MSRMSSPFVGTSDTYYDARGGLSPGPSESAGPQGTIRPMRLKVLYSFDDQSKTNCLARWPQIINIRTASLDENTTIGIIELKTCIQAIVAASPELVAKLGQDYTVYAYDYSEYETPLVGQGMLSWVLASSSATPLAPAHQSRTIVTGRVCNNALGLFSGGNHETLEVKLRLVPVPTCLQSEYINSMKQYHSISKAMPAGFDAQAWTDFLKMNPGILSGVPQGRSESPASMLGQPQVGLEHVQRLVSEGYAPPPPLQRSQSSMQRRGSNASNASMADPFRDGSPTPSMHSVASWAPSRRPAERPTSSASNRSRKGQKRVESDVTDPGYVSNEDLEALAPAKKRAKVMKADPPSRNSNSFNRKIDSLRVAASTAASVRVFQPTAIRPSANPIDALEEPPRAPTPVARGKHIGQRVSLPGRSSLGQCPLSANDNDVNICLSDSVVQPAEEASKQVPTNLDSPEEQSHSVAGDSPLQEPGSSPPVIPRISPTPSSPSLPPMPRHDDSGFMSGTLDELFGDGDDEEDRPIDDFDIEMAKAYQIRDELIPKPKDVPVNSIEVVTPGETLQPSAAPEEPKPSLSHRNAHSAVGVKTGTSRSALYRSGSWSQGPTSDLGSDLSDGGGKDPKDPEKKNRKTWNNQKRKEKIKTKLAQSLAAGEMPPFCENCGAIETPTWRKAFSRIHSGSDHLVVIGKKDGDVIAVEKLEFNQDGTTKLFKIYKKTLLPDEKGYSQILMCNPCGLWLKNQRGLRPPKLWVNDTKNSTRVSQPTKPRNDKRRIKAPVKGLNTDAPSEAMPSEAMVQAGDASSPIDIDLEGPIEEASPDDPELPSAKRRALSMQMNRNSLETARSDQPVTAEALAALRRAIQSSPGHGNRIKPVDMQVNDPEDPARRSLFPSPQRPAFHSLAGPNDGADPFGPLTSPSKTPSKSPSALTPYKSKVLSPLAHRTYAMEDEVQVTATTPSDIFNNNDDDMPRLTTPEPTAPGETSQTSSAEVVTNLLTTPAKQMTPAKTCLRTGDFFSSAAKALLLPRTPSRAAADRHQPEDHHPQELTPFSRHLSQILNNVGSPSKWLNMNMNLGMGMTMGSSPNKALGSNQSQNESTGTPSRVLRDEEGGEFQLGLEEFPHMHEGNGGESHEFFGDYEGGAWAEGVDGDLDEWEDMRLGSSPFRDMDDGDDGVNEEGKEVAIKVEE